ncbi:MAG: DUF2231 domain-containing protein [Alphaproteobacteria bacterium]|nr:DUF2231 domain-containing protein [Alphaproteobacteria bacterium]
MPKIIPNWHPILVHFTVALYVISTLLFILGHLAGKDEWAQKFTNAAYLNLWLGALITLLTVAAGFYAYNTVAHDEPSHLAMTNHKNWALATASFFWIVALWSIFKYRAGKQVGLLFIVAMLFGTGLVGTTGFKGGEVVYRFGLGVMSLPKVDSHHHHSEEWW